MLKYRPDIDGLRAIAVLSVVIFHFSSSLLPGGFIGVDIFFVISGYLITSIIYRDAELNNFSYLTFYKKRALRIFPALIVVLAACLIYGWFFLFQGEYKILGKHVFGGSFFVSNIILIFETGYFDSSSKLKPLLHLWSLGVEEQFYLIWPVVILTLASKKRTGAIATILILLFSFIYCVYETIHNPSISYYSPLTRFWELMAGAILAISAMKSTTFVRIMSANKNITSIFGAMLLVLSIMFIDRGMQFPGYIALMPVLGTFLIIASPSDSTISKLLSLKPIAYIGLISYPLYLWHWPIYSFFRIRTAGAPDIISAAVMILLSIILASATYHLLEKNIRLSIKKTTTAIVSALSLALIGAIGLNIYLSDGFPGRSVNTVAKEYTSISNAYDYYDYPKLMRSNLCHSVTPDVAVKSGCIAKSDDQIFIWGDSYAAALYSGLHNVGKKYHIDTAISQMTDGNGPPFYFDDRKTDTLKTLTEANNERLHFVEMYKPKKIIISWMVEGQNAIFDKDQALSSLGGTIKKIKSVSPESKIIVVGPVPEWNESLIKQIILYYVYNNKTPPIYMKNGLKPQIKAWDYFLNKNIPSLGASYISPYSAMCGDEGCLTRTSKGPKGITAVDWGHLTEAGSIYIVDKYRKEIFE